MLGKRGKEVCLFKAFTRCKRPVSPGNHDAVCCQATRDLGSKVITATWAFNNRDKRGKHQPLGINRDDLVTTERTGDRERGVGMYDGLAIGGTVDRTVDPVFTRGIRGDLPGQWDEDQASGAIKIGAIPGDKEPASGPDTHIAKTGTNQTLGKEPLSDPFELILHAGTPGEASGSRKNRHLNWIPTSLILLYRAMLSSRGVRHSTMEETASGPAS